jgi:hypothetical protein
VLAVIPKRSEGPASNAVRSELGHLAGILPHASTVILSAAKDLLFTSPKPQSIAKKTNQRVPFV